MSLPQGRYQTNPVDFDLYRVQWFSPFLYDPINFNAGCGRTAITLLTGINPWSMPENKHYSDRWMSSTLRKAGFLVLTITQSDVSQNADLIINEINEQHVVLLSQLMRQQEASWSVTHGGLLYHNFEVRRLRGLEMLNKPLLSAYLIYHQKWGKPFRGKER